MDSPIIPRSRNEILFFIDLEEEYGIKNDWAILYLQLSIHLQSLIIVYGL